MRPLYLPDEHLPTGTGTGTPVCNWRTCGTEWPCETAAEYLSPGRCSCGAVTYWEKRGRRHWHLGPRCYTDIDVINRQAADLRAYREAHPHYPPSHYYPPKPRRSRMPRPAYRHTPAAPGDIRPGTWTWIKPGGLHPGWGDIHHLGMVLRPGLPQCGVWLIHDGTVHDVRADHLILSGGPRKARPDWWEWTVADHLERQEQSGRRAENRTAVQAELFPSSCPSKPLTHPSLPPLHDTATRRPLAEPSPS